MKLVPYILIAVLCSTFLAIGQTNSIEVTGKISYKSSQNIYIKFKSTKGITVGDTLFQKKEVKLFPVIVVKYLSSSSCAGSSITQNELKVGDEIIAYVTEKVEEEKTESTFEKNDKNSYLIKEQTETPGNKQANSATWFSGKFSLSSYSQISNIKNDKNNQRWRYRLLLHGEDINNTGISFESYFVFSYRANEWNEITKDFSRALKVYDLGVRYDYAPNGNIWLGRGINRNISNIGAIDGIQAEQKFGDFLTGIIIGSRPDFGTYGINLKLAQLGVFVSREDTLGTVALSNSLAFFEQTNDFKTDRRFVYFQHRNRINKTVRMFLSSEIDLYKVNSGASKTELTLTNIYFSLNYRPINWISFSSSYDARKNVIYYETYKSFSDSLIDAETRQGVKFRTNIRIVNWINISCGIGYRFRGGDLKPSKNFFGSLSYSRIPFITGSINTNYYYLTNSFTKGNIIGIRYSNYLFDGKLNTSFGFRNVRYDFQFNGGDTSQNILIIDLSYRILKNLYFSFTYEGTFQDNTTYSSIYINLSQRF